MKKKYKTTNLIIVSDFHCGCKVGLYPPEPITLDGGSPYPQSDFQRKVWTWWREFWDEWVPRVTRGEPFDVVVNGDVVDGVHHGSTTQISHNLDDQGRIAAAILKPIVGLCERFYMIRGTEAHTGPSGVEENRLARELGAVPDDKGRHARDELWKQVGRALCHIMHHIGTTGSVRFESTAPQSELVAEFAEAGQNREVPPDFVIRSHRHRYIKVDNPSVTDEAGTIVTPGWQGKTPFAFRIAGGRISQPQFGGVLIRQGDEEFYSRRFYRKLKRPRVEE